MLKIQSLLVLLPALALPQSTPAPEHISRQVSAPQLLRQFHPQYSREATIAKVSGVVRAKIVVGADGSVTQVRIAQGIGFGLDEMAEQSIRQWSFQPGEKNGDPVAVMATVEVNFRLRGKRDNVGPRSLIFSLDPGVTRPELIEARQKFEEEGREDDPVTLDLEVDPSGHCKVTAVIGGAPDDVLAVTKHVEKWRFQPATLNGIPVVAHGRLHFLCGKPEILSPYIKVPTA